MSRSPSKRSRDRPAPDHASHEDGASARAGLRQGAVTKNPGLMLLDAARTGRGVASELFVLFSSAAREAPGVTGWGLAIGASPRNLKTILRPATFPAFTVTTRSSFETCREPMTPILKRTSASRPSGTWQHEDYDVLADGKAVGRIYEDASASTPPELRWFWSVTETYRRRCRT